MPNDYVVKIPPNSFLHVQDKNNNVTRLVIGPRTLTCMEHEAVVLGPNPMIVIPPRHYCTIADPVQRTADGQPHLDPSGQAKLRYGDSEIRFEQEPFPLYPGEVVIDSKPQPLTVVPVNKAIRLRATRDFTQTEGETVIKREAGDEWLFEGPGTYIPRVDVQVVESLSARVLKPGQALLLRARRDCRDRQYGEARKTGQQWLMRESGAYMPGVHEEPLEVREPILLSERVALHLSAAADFVDVYGNARQAGDHWIVKQSDAKSHIPDVHETVEQQLELQTLNSREYCVLRNPVDEEGVSHIGTETIVRGPRNFFLQPPYEEFVSKHEVRLLAANDALLLRAKQSTYTSLDLRASAADTAAFIDNGDGYISLRRTRHAGQQWLYYGPGEYWPPLEVEIMGPRKAFFEFEPLNFYLFRPAIAVGAFFIFWAFLIIISYFMYSPGGGGEL